MKFKVTRKEAATWKPIAIPFYQAQNLFNLMNGTAYSAGIYGWDCDYCFYDDIVISIGKNPVGKYIDAYLLEEYDKKARKASCEDKKEILNEFLEKLRGE